MPRRKLRATARRRHIRVGDRSKRVRDGITFDSIAEAVFYDELRLKQRSGLVVFFLLQPRFELPGGTKYTADFQVFYEDGTVAFVDVKPMKAGESYRRFLRSKRQVEALYPVEIEEYPPGRRTS